MAALVGNDPRELLKRLAKGDSLLGDLRTQLKLETPLHCPWNERFQRLLDLPDTPSKFAALSNLGNDFVHASTMYARVLIDELYLPWESKMIKPCDLGGVHGGVKGMPCGECCCASHTAVPQFVSVTWHQARTAHWHARAVCMQRIAVQGGACRLAKRFVQRLRRQRCQSGRSGTQACISRCIVRRRLADLPVPFPADLS